MSITETVRQFISIDGTPSAGSLETSRWLESHCQSLGLNVEVFEESFAGLEQRNIIVRAANYNSQVDDLLFQSHQDTSEPGPITFWTREGYFPFEATIKDGNIYGLGVASVKADLIAKITALAELNSQVFSKMNPVLILTYGEESGMHGMLRLIRRGKIKGTKALISEPTNLSFVNAAKGYAAVEIQIPFSEQEKAYREGHNLLESVSTQSKIFVGKSAISSDPSQGDSAILKMFNYLDQLPDGVAIVNIDGGVSVNAVPSDAMIEFDLVSDLRDSMVGKIRKAYLALQGLEAEFKKYSDADFENPLPTLNVGTIRTNENEVVLEGSCRIPPVVTDAIYQKWMVELQTSAAKIGAEVKVSDYKRPYRTDTDSDFFKSCKVAAADIGLAVDIQTQGNINEASLLSRIGVNCISFGPGLREGNVHTPKEHVSLKDIETSVGFYKKLIERVCI